MNQNNENKLLMSKEEVLPYTSSFKISKADQFKMEVKYPDLLLKLNRDLNGVSYILPEFWNKVVPSLVRYSYHYPETILKFLEDFYMYIDPELIVILGYVPEVVSYYVYYYYTKFFTNRVQIQNFPIEIIECLLAENRIFILDVFFKQTNLTIDFIKSNFEIFVKSYENLTGIYSSKLKGEYLEKFLRRYGNILEKEGEYYILSVIKIFFINELNKNNRGM